MSRTPTHPGAHLAERLAELNMSAAELGRRLAVPTNRITGILNGQRGITGDTALRLGHFFDMPAEHWLNLQTVYELGVAERKLGADLSKLPTLNKRKPSRGKSFGVATQEEAS
jgi:addiction module HigA family antidote